ncbi:hypothetical protein STBA_02640 [Streptomyces sp. MP131-18]|nr:hypothetical protein STBA_02640 [Streptomyces sp. MP131-18]
MCGRAKPVAVGMVAPEFWNGANWMASAAPSNWTGTLRAATVTGVLAVVLPMGLLVPPIGSVPLNSQLAPRHVPDDEPSKLVSPVSWYQPGTGGV